MNEKRITNAETEFLEVSDVMELLHVSRSTIERRMRDGTLPKLKCGRRTLLRRKDLFRLVKEAPAT